MDLLKVGGLWGMRLCMVGDAGITRTEQSRRLTHAELGGEAALALVVNRF